MPAVKKYLDANGLAYFAQKLNEYPTNDVIAAVVDGVQDALDEKMDTTVRGSANGVASLDSNGLVPIAQIPSDVHDVLEYAEYSDFPLSGAVGIIYIDKSTNEIYRWNTNGYVQIGSAPTAITNAEIDAIFA